MTRLLKKTEVNQMVKALLDTGQFCVTEKTKETIIVIHRPTNREVYRGLLGPGDRWLVRFDEKLFIAC